MPRAISEAPRPWDFISPTLAPPMRMAATHDSQGTEMGASNLHNASVVLTAVAFERLRQTDIAGIAKE
jgi:hypothetical protein